MISHISHLSMPGWFVKNLRAANTIASTSYCMAKSDTQSFRGFKDRYTNYTFWCGCVSLQNAVKLTVNNDRLVIGTVKTMADKYGIDILIQAFALF